MKSLGIVRKVDNLGRFVLPIETRRMLNIGTADTLEVYMDDDKIVLKKYEPCCIYCGEAADVITYKDKRICHQCLEQLNKLANE